MRSRPIRWIAIGVILVAVSVVALKYVLFFDAARYWESLLGSIEVHDGRAHFRPGIITVDQAWFDDAVRRFHTGPPPCLRYVGPGSISAARVDELAQAVEDAGLLELFEQHGYFNSFFFKWRTERADRAHELDEQEEILALVTSRVGWSHRLLIRLNRGKLIQTGRTTGQGAASLIKQATEQERALTPRQLDRVRELWSRFRVETTPGGLVQLARRVRSRLTVARMRIIGRALLSWKEEHAALPGDLRELVSGERLTPVQIRDGWHMEIQLDQRGDRVRLVSLGADRREGGSGDDRDLTRELNLAPAAGD